MYFPYLRGKQFELLALRELALLPLLADKVSPIIEPIKADTKSIITMIRQLPPDLKIQIIVNPEFGELTKPTGIQKIAELIRVMHSLGFKNVIPCFLISKDNDVKLGQEYLKKYEFNMSGYSLVHLNQTSLVKDVVEMANSNYCYYNIIGINHVMALRRSFKAEKLAYITDLFNRQIKNADYITTIDENFSNDHLFFAGEGFIGYGDYLTIGYNYIEGGRLPWAVAIHLTYQDEDTKNIRIRHFVSDSNADDSDTAGKFSEALDKLVIFVDDNSIQSIATEAFRNLKHRGAFPGLGTIKKLSIMHHIELVQSLM